MPSATSTELCPLIDRLVKNGQLPALPQSAIRMLELSRDERNGPPEYALSLEADPGLASQVLKFVNSSYFGFGQEIRSVRQALVLVGVRTIKNFVLWNAVFSLMPHPKCGPFEVPVLWYDSLRRAVLARSLGKRFKLREAEDLFSAALLQDMAIPILAKEFPHEYAELLSRRAGGAVRLSALEQERFGWTHAEVAGMLATHWKLPRLLVDLIAAHASNPSTSDVANAPASAARVIELSTLLPSAADDSWHEMPQFEALWHSLAERNGESVLDLLEQIDRECEEFAPVLKLTRKGPSLADRCRQSLARCAS